LTWYRIPIVDIKSGRGTPHFRPEFFSMGKYTVQYVHLWYTGRRGNELRTRRLNYRKTEGERGQKKGIGKKGAAT
jgi:hypothetical protein